MRSMRAKKTWQRKQADRSLLCVVFLICLSATNALIIQRDAHLSLRKPSCVQSQQLWSKGTANSQPGSDLFPGKGPYVPMGLSEEEYKNIRNKEAKELKSKNFGAWGPRFKRTDTPDGDWMVMPNLWTNGVNLRARPGVMGADVSASYNKSPLSRIGTFINHNGPGFLLAYILLDCLVASVAIYKATELTMRKAILLIIKFSLWKKKTVLSMVFLKSHSLKIGLACVATPFMKEILEKVNRRLLWTRRRTILSITVGALISLGTWASLLILLKRIV